MRLGVLFAIVCLATPASADGPDDAPIKPPTAKTSKTSKAKPKKSKTKAAAKKSSKTASRPKRETIDKSRFSAPDDASTSPAVRYGEMPADACEAELHRRNIPFASESATRGVIAPVRLLGTLHGVDFHTDAKPKDRATTPYEIADCRLVLALDDLSAILERHDIVEVVHYSMYRPPDKSWPVDKPGARHNGALALDAAKFIDKDGHALSVLDDFHGHIGGKTCGDGAKPDVATDNALKIRDLLCEIVSTHLFNVVLTPNYNRPHRNHFHLEVTSGVKWFLVH